MYARPDVDVRLPATVHPGEDFTVTITLDADAPTPIHHADLTLEGNRWTRFLQASTWRRILSTTTRIADARELPAGRTTLSATFSMPADAPPTHAGELFGAQYFVFLHVAIPWWLDVRTSWDLSVGPRSHQRPARRPAVVCSPTSSGPFVELALDDQAFAPGDAVRGAVAVGNVVGRAVEGVDLALVATEVREDSSVEVHRSGITKMVTARDQGARIEFELSVPKHVTPTFATADGVLAWAVEARVEFTERSPVAVTVPIVLERFAAPVGPGGADAASARAADLSIGTHRWRSGWEATGRRFGLALHAARLELEGELSGRRAVVVEDGGSLVGRLAWRSWEIGLAIRPHRILRTRIALGHDELDERFDVSGRDEEQVRAFLRPSLVAALLRFPKLELGDAGARVERESAAFDEHGMTSFLSDLADLARAVAEAGDAMPAPSSMAAHAETWRAFANERAARFEPGTMRVLAAIHEGVHFDVSTVFAEAIAVGARVVVHLEPALSEAVDVEDERALAGMAIADRVGELRAAVRDLRIASDAASFEVEGPLEDPASVLPSISLLSAIAQRIRGIRQIGPYR